MHTQALNNHQLELTDLLKPLQDQFGMVGGTALALQIGHRRSVDFDLFTTQPFNTTQVEALLLNKHQIDRTIISSNQELTLMINQVKLTFYHFPFPITFPVKWQNIISLADPLTIAAMKAYALGRRSEWKDYLDLYVLFEQFSLDEVTNAASKIFGGSFDEKLFRSQLTYLEDVDMSIEIDWLITPPSNERIKQRLTEIAIS